MTDAPRKVIVIGGQRAGKVAAMAAIASDVAPERLVAIRPSPSALAPPIKFIEAPPRGVPYGRPNRRKTNRARNRMAKASRKRNRQR